MARDDLLQIPGTVTEILAGGHFRIRGQRPLSSPASAAAATLIKVIPGDHVTIAVSPYDPTHGLIVRRG
jgi:translation initiation factor IF-1